jgi:hypothetical protein
MPSFIFSDGSLLSNLFFSFRDAAREMIANGVPANKVLGDSYKFDVELFFRDRTPEDPFTADTWACEIAKKVEDFDLFVLLGGCALSTAYMRVSLPSFILVRLHAYIF